MARFERQQAATSSTAGTAWLARLSVADCPTPGILYVRFVAWWRRCVGCSEQSARHDQVYGQLLFEVRAIHGSVVWLSVLLVAGVVAGPEGICAVDEDSGDDGSIALVLDRHSNGQFVSFPREGIKVRLRGGE